MQETRPSRFVQSPKNFSTMLIPVEQDFLPKLKAHLLPRLKAILIEEARLNVEGDAVPIPNLSGASEADQDRLFFKSDRMYRHHLLRVNYTAYDVRRSQDIVHPGTSHRDIMVLADDDNPESHPFLYARVLGIFHVNVIYTGCGMLDYSARRLDFLWVRWYQCMTSFSWKDYRLDEVRFPPMAQNQSFGFVDPHDVLRACHVIPAFKRGMVRFDDASISRIARDAEDWKSYCVNRWECFSSTGIG